MCLAAERRGRKPTTRKKIRTLVCSPGGDARLGIDERSHDLAGGPAKRERRTISEAVRVKVSNELA